MIHTVIYLAWLITLYLGFYSIEVATEKWGFPGRLAAFVVWGSGGMLTGLGLPLLLHVLLGDEFGIYWKFSIGALVGIVFNVIFFLVGRRLERSNKKAASDFAGERADAAYTHRAKPIAFLSSFPCFTILGSHNRDSDTGDILFGDNFRFATQEVTPGGERRIAIFTDAALAESFRLAMSNPQKYRIGRLSTAGQLRDFLQLAEPHYARVAVDLNHRTRIGRHFPIHELIAEIDRHLASQEDQDGQA